jgi:predicted outer membrane repeat protein
MSHMYLQSQCYVRACSQCVFLNNTSNSSGGAVTAGSNDTTSVVNITACTFNNNQAVSQSGGALYLTGAAYIHNTIISNNAAKGSGGAIDASQAALTISGTVFYSNVAHANGGAIYSIKPLIVNDTVFTASKAEGNGGAVYHFSSANFNNCNFTENLSLQHGGAISSEPKSSLVIANSVLTNNTASYAGGAIFIDTPTNEFVIADTVMFRNNTAVCCYANNGGISTSTSCLNVDSRSGTGANECCLAKYYSDGKNCQLCTKELTCDNIIGANTSTVAVASGLWRASTTSLKTYSCWNSAACIGGAAVRSTNDYCATGYKGPCKYCYTDILQSMQVTLCTALCILFVRYASLCSKH